MKKYKRELVLLAVIIALALGTGLLNHIHHSGPASRVEVVVIGEDSDRTLLETFDLSKDISFTIITEPAASGEPEGTNLLMIKNGEVWISEANCPNHDCVKQGKISMNGEMLVCLPHKLTVSIVRE